MPRTRVLVLGLIALAAALGLAYLAREEREERSATAAPAPLDGNEPDRSELSAAPVPATVVAAPAGTREPLPAAPGARANPRERDEALRSLQVSVVEPGGAPLAGAHVQTFEDSRPGRFTTDADGRCELLVPAAVQRLLLLVERDGYRHLRTRRPCEKRLSVVLRPATELVGRVLDEETGRAIPGAVVEGLHVGCFQCEPDRAQADDEGRYELAGVPCGSTDLAHFRVRAAGYPRLDADFALRERVPTIAHDFLLRRGFALEGEVLDFSTGRAVPGATLKIGPDTLSADEQGRFSGVLDERVLRELKEGRYSSGPRELVVQAPGYCKLSIPLADLEVPLLVRLPRGGRVQGAVKDAEGRPLPRARIQLREAQTPFGQPQESATPATPLAELPDSWEVFSASRQTGTGPRGRYALEGVEPWLSLATLQVECDGYEEAELVLPGLAPGQEYELDIELRATPRGGTVSGELMLNGEPAAGLVMWQHGDEVNRDAARDGHYRLTNVPAGPVTLTVDVLEDQRIGELIPEATALVTVEPGVELRHDFDLELPFAPISGTVSFDDGSLARGLSVRASSKDSRLGLKATTDENGRYELRACDLGVALDVSIHAGSESQRREGIVPGTTGVDFVLPALGFVRFRVVDRETREPVQGFGLAWRPAGRGEYAWLNREALDPEGFYHAQVPLGRVDLFLWAGQAGYGPGAHENVLVDRQDPPSVVFELQRAEPLVIQLEPASAPNWEEIVVTLPPSSFWADLALTRDQNGNHFSCGGRYPGICIPFLQFGPDGRCQVLGLAPRRYSFKAFPDEIAFEPDEIVVTGAAMEPVVVRWQQK